MTKLLTKEEVAEMLGVTPSTIYQWSHEGFIPYMNIKNLVRFRQNDIDKWIEDRVIDGRRTRTVEVRELV
jgi:excisionase family DNA binding protein